MLPAAAEAAATVETEETEAAQAILMAAEEAAATAETVERAQAAAVVDFSPTAQMAPVIMAAAVVVSLLMLLRIREPMAEC